MAVSRGFGAPVVAGRILGRVAEGGRDVASTKTRGHPLKLGLRLDRIAAY